MNSLKFVVIWYIIHWGGLSEGGQSYIQIYEDSVGHCGKPNPGGWLWNWSSLDYVRQILGSCDGS